MENNWALLYAQECAFKEQVPLQVIFCLTDKFLDAQKKHFAYMIEGLKIVEKKLEQKNIPFILLKGEIEREIIKFANKNNSKIICDFTPLKIGQQWRTNIAKETKYSVEEVDAHNIVPVWIASQKQEFGAYTLRPKIHKVLNEFLTSIPQVKNQDHKSMITRKNIWPKYSQKFQKPSGEEAAQAVLKEFIEKKFKKYPLSRNDPNQDAQSNLSSYLHFGQIASQDIALQIKKENINFKAQTEFLEELIVRKELADNFCFYNNNYDSVNGFPDWAKKTLDEHRKDKREYLYSEEEFEKGKTHDELWNAAQDEMVKTGKMHGYMRMYWAKKILEWTNTPEEAMKVAIYLNDKYELDGRDPNGYTGIAWSIGGVHDRAWFDRPIFGKIRYMSASGCAKKFDTKEYIERIRELKRS
jgi:deoxyribodipyrimidine photo-lyase